MPRWIKYNLFVHHATTLLFALCDCASVFFVNRLQPNVDTRQKQLAAWCSLVLSYCRHHKLYTLDVMEAQESPVFNNKKIERILTRVIVRHSHNNIWFGSHSATLCF